MTTYRDLWTRFKYAVFTAGLCGEILVVMACRDVAHWIYRGSLALIASGEQQLAAVPEKGGRG
jgi:hypothetical protein